MLKKASITMLAAVFLALGISSAASAKVIYVDDDATGTYDGASWENAYNFLQDALMFAGAGDEIRVAQGVYKPDDFVLSDRPSRGREETFELINGLTLKGGYAGFGEPDPNARNVELYETVLSGDLDGDDIDVPDPCDLPNEPTRAENSYHVLIASVGEAEAILDGFTITAGNANGEGYPLNQGSGGGIQIRWPFDEIGEEGPVLTNCTFIENSADYGGGVYNDEPAKATLTNCTFTENFADWGGGIGNGGYPILVNCTFSGNCAGWRGGAMANGETRATLEDCTFLENRAEYGGVMYNGESGATLTNCTLIGNSAETGGGAVYNHDSGVTMTNCLVSKNSCSEKGGVVYLRSDDGATLTNCILTANSAQEGGVLYAGGEDSYARLTNCTLTGNRAADNGGALYIDDPEEARLTLTNCILWSDAPQEIHPQPPGSETVITHSDVQGIMPDGGNINADPCFVDPGHWDPNGTPEDSNDDFFVDGDYHLKSQAGRWDPNSQTWVIDDVTSPCIDAGDPLTPIMHEPFPNGGIINMGAYGGTSEASKSYFGEPVCETIVAGDINGDCVVDFRDFFFIALHWLEER
jgi:hypothetical protein